MPDNLGGILEIIQDELIEPAEDRVIRRYIRDFLFDIRSERFRFSEASGTFSTIANQSDYPLGEDGVPGDIMGIDLMRVQQGSTFTNIREVQIGEFRSYQTSNLAASNRPQVFCLHSESIKFWPTPSSVETIAVDYQIDPTYDTVSGQKFIEDTVDDSFTNVFFRDARDLMVSYVLARWGLGRGQHPDMAQNQGVVYKKALSRLRTENAVIKMGDGRMRPHI